jgi:hypothetical protein
MSEQSGKGPITEKLPWAEASQRLTMKAITVVGWLNFFLGAAIWLLAMMPLFLAWLAGQDGIPDDTIHLAISLLGAVLTVTSLVVGIGGYRMWPQRDNPPRLKVP